MVVGIGVMRSSPWCGKQGRTSNHCVEGRVRVAALDSRLREHEALP